MTAEAGKQPRSKFPPLYWLVVVFEFFERGAYYGMMSVLSVYLVDELHFAKQDVGLIKGTIQPLLYFLPILSGALADRFGYRRLLMVAFALLGGGYFLTSQATGYAAVFLSLVVMGLGAGTFKPIISGTIARCTDPSNATLGFGIFYWSINLGAFLFPLILVPILRDNIGYTWVIIASAICTGILLLPTLLAYREPPRFQEEQPAAAKKPGLLQTLANAFEIIYSPLVLLSGWMHRSRAGLGVGVLLLAGLLTYGGYRFATPAGFTTVFAARAYPQGDGRLTVRGEPNLCKTEPFELKVDASARRATLVLFDPGRLEEYAERVLAVFQPVGFLSAVDQAQLLSFRDAAVQKTILEVALSRAGERGFALEDLGEGRIRLSVSDLSTYRAERAAVLALLQAEPRTAALEAGEIDALVEKADQHPFLLLFLGLLLLAGLTIQRAAVGRLAGSRSRKWIFTLTVLAGLYGAIWLLPGLSLFARVLTSVLSMTLLSLGAIDYGDLSRFRDHLRFLAMIAIYSGFWVLYFQMFDSVLWYVQAYVDPTALNDAVNGILAWLGIAARWRFDVEGVTYINAGTIILLQLFISALVRNTKALPTMVVGISLATGGMAILSLSTGIWVFIAGIMMFSIGEMTAHPKFIAYVGQSAPRSRVAMYMGYLFLYGVFGSSIGGVVGANLYVKFIDELNQPRTLWLIFAGIGLLTVVGLLLYNTFVVKRAPGQEPSEA